MVAAHWIDDELVTALAIEQTGMKRPRAVQLTIEGHVPCRTPGRLQCVGNVVLVEEGHPERRGTVGREACVGLAFELLERPGDREAASANEGMVTIPALPLTGTYRVKVAKSGFGTEEANSIALRINR